MINNTPIAKIVTVLAKIKILDSLQNLNKTLANTAITRVPNRIYMTISIFSNADCTIKVNVSILIFLM